MNKSLGILFLIGMCQIGFSAVVAPELGIQFIGTERPSSFPKLLLVHVENPGFTPLDLPKMLATSLLIIDGQPSRRSATTYNGPVTGLPPMGEWDGCLSLDDYAPPLTPGKHKVSLKLGNAQSTDVKVRWEAPVNWRQGNMKSRLKEIQALGEALQDGLPRGCVEQWLTVKDGGLQEEDKIRYFLEPEFKAVVPYRQMYESRGMHSVVDGPVKVYKEARATD